jgi:hypothetical protein
MRFLAKEENSQRAWDELSDPDRHRARAADGWLDFGLLPEAAEELRTINAASATNPVVLKMHLRFWCQTWLQLHAWENLLCAARATLNAAPKLHFAHLFLSTALSNIGKLDEALKLLLDASDLPSPFKELYTELESRAARSQDCGSYNLDPTHPIQSET